MADLAILNQREREMIIMPKLTLKMLRAGTEMTQAEVAEKLAISPATWSKWENGKSFPNVVEIKKIEKLFNIGYSDIKFLSSDTV
ncbi:helix-turn-helix transcriptional regulator [Ligilactobacillus murinus]|uniref:helix-turn-helix transcriptional regulator n=1 Tax=Ligilactobacillus murinus TaxID=1622 RepID=UPI001F04FBA5|nr:helix-turn-helix transcriptional regulator [Ligilactobacillus murinus]